MGSYSSCIDQVRSTFASSDNVLIKSNSQSDSLDSSNTVNICNLSIVFIRTSSNAATQRYYVSDNEIRVGIGINNSYSILFCSERSEPCIVREWIICTNVGPGDISIRSSTRGMYRNISTTNTTSSRLILVSSVEDEIIDLIRSISFPLIYQRSRPCIISKIYLDGSSSTNVVPCYRTISYNTDLVSRCSSTRSGSVSSSVDLTVAVYLIIDVICLTCHPLFLRARNSKVNLFNQVLLTSRVSESISIVKGAKDLTDLILSTITWVVDRTNRSLYNRTVCLCNALGVELLNNSTLIELNVLVEGKLLNVIHLRVCCISNVVFCNYIRRNEQSLTER